MEQKSFLERYGDEVLTDNSNLNHYAQCRDCQFRDRTMVRNQECGWDKGYCKIYEEPEYKPDEIRENREPCEYYEPDKKLEK